MEKFAVAIIVCQLKDDKLNLSTIGSQLYIVESADKESAIGFVIEHPDIKTLFNQNYVILNKNSALIK
jgi:hypothetical protein